MAMEVYLHVITTLFSFIFSGTPLILYVKGYENPAPYFIGDVAINCGYHGNSTAHDGRQWYGDTGTRSVISVLQPRGKSNSLNADQRSLSADPIPYMTARISATEFYYTFQVNPGQKFIRLHFHPSSFKGFKKSQDFFTVRAGTFTLLRNFSASLTAEALGVKHFVKEYCLNIEEDKYLNLTFSPCQSTKQRNIYAFVNGIEIISMPTGLYYTPDGDLGARIVGQRNKYFVDNSTALEMVQRLNIGGSSISPIEDFGMFRRWNEDANYLLEPKLQLANHFVHQIKYSGIAVYTAPLRIYQTSWKRRKDTKGDELHKFNWKIPLDVGFGYLVRLHFSEFEFETTGFGGREFSVIINNQVAEDNADVIRWSGGNGVPIYRDYMVMVKGFDGAGKSDLLIALRSFNDSVIGLLNGLEIFKLSNPDNNLASRALLRHVSTSWSLKIQKSLLGFGKKNVFVTGITIILIILNLIVFKLRRISEETGHEEKDTPLASSKQSFRRFSLAEIISATQNFSDAFLIGRGGFGNVYKGFIHGGSEIVAIKRLKSNSKQGSREFWTEIDALSKIRHIHLVPLIGYCNDRQELILVYKYMPRGTLADNLYKNGRKGNDGSPLTWEQRLRICIGAARGLDYLHTGIEYGIIHRDVKDSNILLDNNFVAKISDFGLSKLGKVSESQGSISTKVKGTFGYLDPDYITTHKPTRKTDVYAFGVVMLVVLCGRPAIDKRIPWEPQILLSLFRECIIKGDINDIIDPSLQGNFTSESLKEFIKSVENCVDPEPKERPSMSQVVTSLEYALELQERTKSFRSKDAASSGQPCNDGIIQDIKMSKFSFFSKLQESTISPVEEGITDKVIELQTRQGDFQSIRKPLWAWPWEALRKKRKNLKKKVLLPEDGVISRVRVSEMKEAEDGVISHFTLSEMIEATEDGLIFYSTVSEPKEATQNGHIYCFTISEMKEATENFSDTLLIRYTGFGTTYKGRLPNGLEIAVERFFRSSWQGVEVFQLICKLQHKNIGRFLGFCLEGEEKSLIHEFLPKRSLDYFLFDPEKQPMLDWSRRHRLIEGIARGLLYLHDDSRPRIIHCDLSARNVLLDANMDAKIAGFGSARIVGVHQTEVERFKIVGTYGYMSPEYATYGRYSIKSDVYSFGVLVLEILCGKKNTSRFYKSDITVEDLISHAWRNWRDGTPLALLDPAAGNCYDREEVIQYIHVALLCVQDNVEQRPTMDSVVRMLNACPVSMPVPQQPAWRTQHDNTRTPKMHISYRTRIEDFPQYYEKGFVARQGSLKPR